MADSMIAHDPLTELEQVRDWARQKIQGGAEPPWAWYQYMKLVETIDAILDGVKTVIPMESSRQSAPRSGSDLRLVVTNDRQDTAQHRYAAIPVKLPM